MPVVSKIVWAMALGVFALKVASGLALPLSPAIGQAANVVRRDPDLTSAIMTLVSRTELRPQPIRAIKGLFTPEEQAVMKKMGPPYNRTARKDMTKKENKTASLIAAKHVRVLYEQLEALKKITPEGSKVTKGLRREIRKVRRRKAKLERVWMIDDKTASTPLPATQEAAVTAYVNSQVSKFSITSEGEGK